jgi:peptidoglycan-associated lipoprotein
MQSLATQEKTMIQFQSHARTQQLRSLGTTSLRAALLSAALLAGITGCHKNTGNANPNAAGPVTAPPAPLAAPTASLVAEPLAIDLGQSVVLNWRSTNGTSVEIDGIGAVSPNGTQTVSPSTSTNFHLVVKGDGGTTEASVRVTVRIPVAPVVPTESAAPTADMGPDAVFHENVQDAFFDYDSYELRTDAQASSVKAAAFLVSHPDIRVVIGGYCDDRGSAEYNLALGENRANAAKTALVTAGVAAARIRVVSYGKEKQFCTEETDACWQENRRAQFSLDR